MKVIDSSLAQVLEHTGLDIWEGNGEQFSAAVIATGQLSRAFCPGHNCFPAGRRGGLSVAYGLEAELR
jgi:hypothetical protein